MNKAAVDRVRSLPKAWVAEGLKLADGARVFDKLMSDLTHDELLAVAAHGWKAARKDKEQSVIF